MLMRKYGKKKTRANDGKRVYGQACWLICAIGCTHPHRGNGGFWQQTAIDGQHQRILHANGLKLRAKLRIQYRTLHVSAYTAVLERYGAELGVCNGNLIERLHHINRRRSEIVDGHDQQLSLRRSNHKRPAMK